MGKTFEKVHVRVLGSFDNAAKIPGWLKANGGKYHRSFNSQITHLIVTEEVYLQNGAEVEKAKKSGKIKIVSFDWLEDSLLSHSKRPKPEKAFLWSTLLRESEGAATKKLTKDPFANKVTKNTPGRRKGKAAAKDQIFMDPVTGETWDAELVRQNAPPKPRSKLRVGIFQSCSTPATYSTYVKYSQVGKSHVDVLAPPKRDKAPAIKAFKEFFHAQTGKQWDDRADDQMPAPKADKQGNRLPGHEGWYVYEDKSSIFSNWMKSYQPPTPAAEGLTDSTEIAGL